MAQVQSITVGTIYNAGFFNPVLLSGNVYSTLSSAASPFLGVDSATPLSVSTLTNLLTSITSISGFQGFMLGTGVGTLARFATFWLDQQSSVFDTAYFESGITAPTSVIHRTPTTTPYQGVSSGAFRLLSTKKTYRFFSHNWYGFGYQRTARIELRARKMSVAEYVNAVDRAAYVIAGDYFIGGFGYADARAIQRVSSYVTSGSGDYIAPIGSFPRFEFTLIGALIAANEPVAWVDRFMDLRASVQQNFSDMTFPRLYASFAGITSEQMACDHGSESPDHTMDFNPPNQNAHAVFPRLINFAGETAAWADSAAIWGAPTTVAATILYPNADTPVFLAAPFPENAPFSSKERTENWMATFRSAVASSAVLSEASVIYYEDFDDYNNSSIAPYSLPWCLYSNVWYSGPVTNSSSRTWASVSSLGMQILPFPGLGAVSGIMPRSIRGPGASSTRYRPDFAGLDVINVLVVSDLSAKTTNASLSLSYSTPGLNSNDYGGANDLLDVRSLVNRSRSLLPGFAGFKTLVFYDVDPALQHERLEFPTTTQVPSTSAFDGFVVHTANWSGGYLNHYERTGQLWANFIVPIHASADNHPLLVPATIGTSLTVTDLCRLSSYPCQSVRDERNALAIQILQQRILQEDASGSYVVWCGTISATTDPRTIAARILANS